MDGPHAFADKRQQEHRLSGFIPHRCNMWFGLRAASNMIPPVLHPGIVLIAAADGTPMYQFAPKGFDLPDLGQDFHPGLHRSVNGWLKCWKSGGLRYRIKIGVVLHRSGPRTGELARPPTATAGPIKASPMPVNPKPHPAEVPLFPAPKLCRQLALVSKMGCDQKSPQDESPRLFHPAVNEIWGEPHVERI